MEYEKIDEDHHSVSIPSNGVVNFICRFRMIERFQQQKRKQVFKNRVLYQKKNSDEKRIWIQSASHLSFISRLIDKRHQLRNDKENNTSSNSHTICKQIVCWTGDTLDRFELKSSETWNHSRTAWSIERKRCVWSIWTIQRRMSPSSEKKKIISIIMQITFS